MTKILHIDASGRHDGSLSRSLSAEVVTALTSEGVNITYRDVSAGLPVVDDTIIAAYFTSPEERTEQQKQAVTVSDELVKELLDNDVYVFGIPMYNFSVPASFKIWADLVARAGMTFKYTENGPVGLLEDKKAYVVISTGGTPVGSDYDHLTPWLRLFFGFIGITDIELIKADGGSAEKDEVIAAAKAQIAGLK